MVRFLRSPRWGHQLELKSRPGLGEVADVVEEGVLLDLGGALAPEAPHRVGLEQRLGEVPCRRWQTRELDPWVDPLAADELSLVNVAGLGLPEWGDLVEHLIGQDAERPPVQRLAEGATLLGQDELWSKVLFRATELALPVLT